jgi:hypothetical protein
MCSVANVGSGMGAVNYKMHTFDSYSSRLTVCSTLSSVRMRSYNNNYKNNNNTDLLSVHVL